MKIASLIAAAGAASAWEVTLLSNNTWVGNDDQPAGGIYTFDNAAGGWNNSTGSCTVSAAGPLSFLNGFDLFTMPYAGGDQYRFLDMSENDRATIEFLVNTDLNGDAPAEDFLTVECDNDSVGDGPFFRSFPNHPQESNVRGSLRRAGGADWSSFAMVFPRAAMNLTFDDPAVVIGEEVGGAVAVDASAAVSDEIWFGFSMEENLAGSWEMQASATE